MLLTGALVGVLYAVVRVKAPTPPPVALFGLLGMVVGQTVMRAL
ncbi:DUF1427 family protein [Streptomyces sp. ISL-36]|nr:DUF1427 family protein [Streptomyces sp. ISL-36]